MSKLIIWKDWLIYFHKLYFININLYLCIIPMETMGKNIEMVPCAIREQRIVRHYNILKTT